MRRQQYRVNDDGPRGDDCQGRRRDGVHPGLAHAPWMRDSIQKFRPAGRVNVRNASTGTGSAGEPSTTWPVASSTVWPARLELDVHRRGHAIAEGAGVPSHAGTLHVTEHHGGGGVARESGRIESAVRPADVSDSLVQIRIADGGRWLLGRRSHDLRSKPPERRPNHTATTVPTTVSKTAPKPAPIGSCRIAASTRWPRREPAARPAIGPIQSRPGCGLGAAGSEIAIGGDGGGSQFMGADVALVGCKSEREPRRPAAGIMRCPPMTDRRGSPLAAPTTSTGGRPPRRGPGASRSQEAPVVAVVLNAAHQLGLARETSSRR